MIAAVCVPWLLCFWFWQVTPEGIHVIDYEEHHGQTVEFYFDLLLDKPYGYETIYLPHDARAKSFQTGRSTIEQFLEPWKVNPLKYQSMETQRKGFPVAITPNLGVQDGINAGRLLLPMLRRNRLAPMAPYRQTLSLTAPSMANLM